MGVNYTAVSGIGFWLEKGTLLLENVIELTRKDLLKATVGEDVDLDDYDVFDCFSALFIGSNFDAKEVGSRSYNGVESTQYYDIMVVLKNPLSDFYSIPQRLDNLREFLTQKNIPFIDTENKDCLIYEVLIQ